MIRSIYIIIALFSSQNLYGQINLVPNASFEDTIPHIGCITGIEIANPWFNPNAATPDLFTYNSSCINSSLNNPSGYQLPKTGLAYAGIFGYVIPSRDYIAIELDSSLTAGCNYYLEFYISLANNFGLACDKIGAGFTDDTTGFKSIQTALPIAAVVESPNGILITDTVNWLKISGSFIATGDEIFLIIGNFNDDINTNWDTVNTSGFLNSAYYYIDDVKLLPCNISNTNEFILNESFCSVYPNPTNGNLNIKFNYAENIVELNLVDIAGRLVTKREINHFTNSFNFSVPHVQKGAYVLRIQLLDRSILKLIIIN